MKSNDVLRHGAKRKHFRASIRGLLCLLSLLIARTGAADADTDADSAQPTAILNALLSLELARRDDVQGSSLNSLFFGDLDGDGQQDAVVLYSHGVGSQGGNAYSQRAAVFVFRSFGFELAFHQRIGQKGSRLFSIGRLQGNIVTLSGQAWRDGDPACCPSGRVNAAFAWDGEKLVEI